MKKLPFRCAALVLVACLIFPVVHGKDHGPDDRDAALLTALLMHLAEDESFNPSEVKGQGGRILLDRHPAPLTRAFSPENLRHFTRNRPLPAEAVLALQRREQAEQREDRRSWTIPAAGKGVAVANLEDFGGGAPSFVAFAERHPGVRAWIKAALPGYTEDGSQGLVCAEVGPSSHGALLIALLDRTSDGWKVAWYRVHSFF
jgi:hypothetical protein